MVRAFYGLALALAMTTAVAWSWVSISEALPAGRAWAEVDTLHLGIHFLGGPRLAMLKGERLRLVASGITDPPSTLTYQWDRDHWELDRRIEYGSNFLWPFLSDGDEEHLVWKGIVPTGPFGNDTYLFYMQTLPELMPRADTLALTRSRSLEYAGASGPFMRWVLHDDFGNLRLFRSSRPGGAWSEMEMPGNGSYGTTIAALDDTSALAVWANVFEIQSAIIRGSEVQLVPVPQNLEKEVPERPKLRWRPAGGHWMAWAMKLPYVKITHFDGTSWAVPESIHCNYTSGNPASYIGQSPDLSQDSYDRPVVAWSAYGSNGRSVICVSCPTESGYPIAEELPVSHDGFLASPARDENGDVWLSWWKYYDGAFWTHSYTAVVVENALISPSPQGPRISWTLSGPAPESWWSILRSGADSTYAVVGRVRAGPTRTVEWTDASATPGFYLYRIRRDCKNSRYETLTDPIPGTVDAQVSEPFGIRLEGGHPARQAARVRVVGAAPGPVIVEVFDVRGRRVASVEGNAGSEGVVSVNLAADKGGFGGRPSAGLYFARARDARGQISSTLKLVYL